MVTKINANLTPTSLECRFFRKFHANVLYKYPNRCFPRVQVTGGVEISTNETEMAQWLVQNGPISIGINANAMQYYRGIQQEDHDYTEQL